MGNQQKLFGKLLYFPWLWTLTDLNNCNSVTFLFFISAIAWHLGNGVTLSFRISVIAWDWAISWIPIVLWSYARKFRWKFLVGLTDAWLTTRFGLVLQLGLEYMLLDYCSDSTPLVIDRSTTPGESQPSHGQRMGYHARAAQAAKWDLSSPAK